MHRTSHLWIENVSISMINQVPLLIECGQPAATDECLTELANILVRRVGISRDAGEDCMMNH